MNISTASLREFQKLSANVKGNNVLPITNYLKFEPGKITKTALTSFVTFDCPEVDEEILVSEKHLYDLLSVSSSTFINISKKGTTIHMTDGHKRMNFEAEEFKLFPQIQGPTKDRVELSDNFVQALYMASYFPIPFKEVMAVYNLVMVGNKTICAGDGVIVFRHTIDENVEPIVLEKSIAASISKLPLTGFAFGENYHFFYTSKAVFGFSVPEVGYVDMNKFFTLNGQKPNFSLSANDLMSFNTMAMRTAEDAFVHAENGRLSLKSTLTNVPLDEPMEALTVTEPFNYHPEKMNRLLTAIKSDVMYFYEGDRMYYVKNNDERICSLIMKIKLAD